MTQSDERLDLEDSHQPDAPRVRRIKLPHPSNSSYLEGLAGPMKVRPLPASVHIVAILQYPVFALVIIPTQSKRQYVNLSCRIYANINWVDGECSVQKPNLPRIDKLTLAVEPLNPPIPKIRNKDVSESANGYT